VTRFAPLVRSGGSVLDLACGSGRHVRWLVAQGYRVTGVDRDAAALAELADLGASVDLVTADLEGAPWPLPGRRFDGIVVTNYLWRALLPRLAEALAPEGVLVYETFALGNEAFGKPSNPDFLLRPGELLAAFEGLRVLAFEDGYEGEPPRCVQRLAALNADPAAPATARLRLGGTAGAPAGTPQGGPRAGR
jgi:SAM-dependent methyltransferase